MKDTEHKEPKKELSNIRPKKVSLVDLGANNEIFFVAKGFRMKKEDDGEPTELAKAVDSFLQGITTRVTTLKDWLNSAEVDDEGTVPQQVSDVLKRTRDSVREVNMSFLDEFSLENMRVPGDVRDKVVTMLDVVTEKIVSANEAVNKSSEEVSEEFVKSLSEVISALDSVEVEMAVWSTAYVNGLPDSAFLYVKSGGKKDSEGKTTPRSNRKFPYKDKNGKVDLPHLRNAIARIPQAKGLSDDEKKKLQAKARKILAANTEKRAEGAMREEIMELIKSAGEVELDIEVVKKKLTGAMAGLKTVMDSLSIDTGGSRDFWDLRYKISNAISELIDAAALQGIVGFSEKSANPHGEEGEKETAMSEKETEKSVEEETAKSSDSSEKKTEKTEKTVEAEPKEETKEKSTATPVDDKKSLTDAITAAVASAVAPISEKLDELNAEVQKQKTEVEKMANERAVAKGGAPDETQGNVETDTDSGPRSMFSGIMPDHLKGVYSHGEKIKD